MSEYEPHSWVVLSINFEGKKYFKVLGGWSGGYLDGDYWRMNSGITHMEEDEDYYYFHGYSGSVYKCRKESQHLRGTMHGIYNQLKEKYPDNVEIIDVSEMILEDTNV